jgi:hypothetical protein
MFGTHFAANTVVGGPEHGGLAMLSPTNVISLNEFDAYLGELGERVKGAAHV